MSYYQHLSITEREKMLILYTEKKSLRFIAKSLGRNVSTIAHELSRNTTSETSYSAINAQNQYQARRKNCKRHKLLENTELYDIVHKLF